MIKSKKLISDRGITPDEIRYSKSNKCLTVTFDNGRTFSYSAELLRVESPSAEVKGHNTSEKRIVPGCQDVGITKIDYVGNYAVRIHFDDMHNTGIYSWLYLYELGETKDKVWNCYLKRLEGLGLKRKSTGAS
ncbi:MAG: hypothetical protein CL568_08045 [Alphaproteobacteria bacterium]|jgi:DUF971 family protein|nr:hypothetical protein [Alphaproteobacteria bacterium]PPR14034.1 MAG: hypothetical protein CFH42_00902 [Alphaproteobacteria bacterium MarineAlpha12_Bin1]|tara:strand:- start:3522 stop:3920 length:399 start_codon:yes stop_codon:yes gene_type:complete